MSYNYEKNWFEYQGRYYGYGTIVKLKPEVYRGIIRIEKREGKMIFVKGLTNGSMRFVGAYNPDGWEKIGIYGIWNPNEIIEYIIKPVYVELRPVWEDALKNYKSATPEHKHLTFPGTLWYAIIMIGGAIFNARWIIWIIATIIYFSYWINKYRD